MSDYWSRYPEIQNDLQTIQEIMKSQSKSGEKPFDAIIEDWIGQKGKMLRPGLFLLATEFGSNRKDEASGKSGASSMKDSVVSFKERLRNHAAAIEMIHLATLIHDDIIDEAFIRRGKRTLQTAMGKDYAVYTGDYLICKAMALVSDREIDSEAMRRLSAGMTQVCLGEIRQYHSRYDRTPDLRRYFKIIAGKTAALFTFSLYFGALEGGADERTCRLLGRIGYNMGMAFQVVDDLLDFEQDGITGKTAYRDLVQGCYNLPVRLALGSRDSERLILVLERIADEESLLDDVAELVRQTGALEASKEYAKKYTDRAIKYTSLLPELPAKQALVELIKDLLVRKM